MVAVEAAQIVGDEGYVMGIDIASGIVDRATQKVAALGLNNIEFQVADAEAIVLVAIKNNYLLTFFSIRLALQNDDLPRSNPERSPISRPIL